MAQQRIGPIYIYGPIGAGKTSILRRLYEQLSHDEKYKLAYLISPNLKTSNSFLRLLLETFEVKTEKAYTHSLANFQNFLIEQDKAGVIPLLLVDEAQNMTRDILKLIHYLLNYETATIKLLQIVLVGQNELAAKILRYRELASRMYPIAFNNLSEEEMREMLRFRWTVAGGQDLPFEEAALNEIHAAIYAYSKGLPRDAIKLCDELLRHLTSQQSYKASLLDLETVASSLNLTKNL
jgi:general secretion pathway protein A